MSATDDAATDSQPVQSAPKPAPGTASAAAAGWRDDDDAPALLQAALALATHRVVVKRSRKAPAIGGEQPGYVLEGKSSRFDIYPKKSLKAKAETIQP